MKRLMIIGILGAWALMVIAQVQPSAQDILAQVSRTYQAFKTIEADFLLSMHSAQNDVDQKQSGQIALKNNKYRVVLDNQLFISDGKTQWTVLKAEREVQISDVDKSATLNPTNIFTFYKNGYIADVTGSSRVNGKDLYEIQLTPTRKDQSIFKIKMRVNKDNYHIFDTQVYEKNGNQYRYQVKNLKTNTVIPAGTFVFNKSQYPDAELVDLR